MRFFLTTYSGIKENKPFRGNITFSYDKFPSHSEFIHIINMGDVILENIIELDIFDYYEFNGIELDLKEYCSFAAKYLRKKYDIVNDNISDFITTNMFKSMFKSKVDYRKYIIDRKY